MYYSTLHEKRRQSLVKMNKYVKWAGVYTGESLEARDGGVEDHGTPGGEEVKDQREERGTGKGIQQAQPPSWAACWSSARFTAPPGIVRFTAAAEFCLGWAVVVCHNSGVAMIYRKD